MKLTRQEIRSMAVGTLYGAGSATVVCVALVRHAYGLLIPVIALAVVICYKAIEAYGRIEE